jgi:hypothetical protein
MKVLKASSIVLSLISLGLALPTYASSLCTNITDCTLTLDTSNGFVSGSDFGTVHLQVTGTDTVEVTVDVPGFDVIVTGFPGSFGFTDSLTTSAAVSGFSSGYSGSQFDTTQDQHFDGFGYFGDAVATTGPHNGSGLSSVSFDITQSGLNNVNDLLNLSAAPAGHGEMYFVVDAGIPGTASTGLLGVSGTAVPEPRAYAFLIAAIIGIAVVAQRRKQRLVGSV